jgi:hypothetical protein
VRVVLLAILTSKFSMANAYAVFLIARFALALPVLNAIVAIRSALTDCLVILFASIIAPAARTSAPAPGVQLAIHIALEQISVF